MRNNYRACSILNDELAKIHSLDELISKAKVGSDKSLAGYTKPTNASKASKRIFECYKHLTVDEIAELLKCDAQ